MELESFVGRTNTGVATGAVRYESAFVRRKTTISMQWKFSCFACSSLRSLWFFVKSIDFVARTVFFIIFSCKPPLLSFPLNLSLESASLG